MNPTSFHSRISEFFQHPIKVLDETIPFSSYTPIDISENQAFLQHIDVSSSKAWETYIQQYLITHQAQVAYGGYLEVRNLYERSSHFTSLDRDNLRNIHLGMDLWATAGTRVLASIEGKVHSFQDNNQFGDYGPTIILEHLVDGLSFFTLYGHLSRESINNLSVGQVILQGSTLGTLGDSSVNGDYAPHLHFQIIKEMQGHVGDFPGVCSKQNLDKFKAICPDPNLLLKIPSEKS